MRSRVSYALLGVNPYEGYAFYTLRVIYTFLRVKLVIYPVPYKTEIKKQKSGKIRLGDLRVIERPLRVW